MPRFTRSQRVEFPSTDPNRRGLTDVSYVYMDDRFQTYMITLPLEQDSAERVQAELEKRVRAAAAGGAQEISIT